MSLAIRYTIAMPRPVTHCFHVTVEVTGWQRDEVDLVLPAWTPGSYLIREFSRHVDGFRAETLEGKPLDWERRDKATWRVRTPDEGGFRARYEVYANDLTVRTSHLDDSHGYFNGTNVFLYVEGFNQHPVTLVVEPAPGWHTSIALPQDAEGRYHAPTYDLLADSPAEVGTHRVLRFEALDTPHEIAIWGRGNEDESALLRDTKKIVETTAAMFGNALPYDRYLFILHLGDGIRGGLEHRNSTTVAADRWSFAPPREYEKVQRLIAHEFFHTWNVKRIRPSNLGPFDYTREVYTPLLWVMEGFTTYYDVLLLRRAGLISPARALQLFADRIISYRQQPGRHVQSLEESSLTAWIKFYRQDENYVNTGISYYLKGSLVALMLDLLLRSSSGNATTLDDVLRYLWQVYGQRDVGFAPDEFYAALERVGETELGPFLNRFVRGVEELPLEDYLALAGLEVESGRKSDSPTAWMGLLWEDEPTGLFIKSVLRDSPAEEAGLMPRDRLVALDGYELPKSDFLLARLREKEVGDSVTLHFFRYGRLHDASVTLRDAPPDKMTLRPSDAATPLQQRILESWLDSPWEAIQPVTAPAPDD